MELVKKVKEQFLENKEKILQGKLVGLPWHEVFPRLGEYIPVIPPATQIMLVANSGIGKSHAWIGMVVYSLYKLKKLHPEKVYKIRFLIALLEDSKEMFITRLYSMILMDKYGIRADSLTLNSMRKNPLPKEIEDKLNDVEEEINSLLNEHCEVVDSVYNPYGIYKWARNISQKLGTHYNKEMDFSNEDGSTYKHTVYSHYIPNDPDEQVILIVDNLNNLQQEKEDGVLLSERETINRWTRKFGRLQISKHWKWTVLNIMQLSAESEKAQYDFRGNLIIDRVKPSLDGLGNSKESQRDQILIFGLFAPNRYGIETYPEGNGYDITRLKDNYRSFIIMKSNISETNKEIPLMFDGSCSLFREFPKLESMTEKIYREIETKRDVKVV